MTASFLKPSLPGAFLYLSLLVLFSGSFSVINEFIITFSDHRVAGRSNEFKTFFTGSLLTLPRLFPGSNTDVWDVGFPIV